MKNKPNNRFIIGLSFTFSLAYSVIRYNIFKEVPWVDFPLFVFNKVLALSSLFLFAIYQYSIVKNKTNFYNTIKDYAIIFGVMHIIISLLILSPSYFPKFYYSLKFNLPGAISLLSGTIAVGLLLLLLRKAAYIKSSYSKYFKNNAAILFFLAIAVHVSTIGFNGWFRMSTWPGGMPPITLISLIIVIIILVLKFLNRKK